MDVQTIIAIIIGIIVIYFFVKLVVSPLLKAVLGIIIFILAIYILQRSFHFDLSRVLAPFGINLNLSKIPYINLVLEPANRYIDQGKNFLDSIWQNASKSFNK